MSSAEPRRRTSTLRSSDAELSELQAQLRDLRPDAAVSDSTFVLKSREARLRAGHCIRQNLFENSQGRHPKDAFRHLGGFQTVLATLKDILQQSAGQPDTEAQHAATLEFLQVLFGILTAALEDHKGNQRFFQQRIVGGGWPSLQSILVGSLGGLNGRNRANISSLVERVFGLLLACALNDDALLGLFGTLKRHSVDLGVGPTSPSYGLLGREIGPSASICNPGAVLVMLEIWKALEAEQLPDQRVADFPSFHVPTVVSYLASTSTSNLAALHNTDLLHVVLPCLLSPQSLSSSHLIELRKIAEALLSQGVDNLDDAHFLYRNAASSTDIAELLQSSLPSSRIPPYVHFDLSLHGFASMELPGIGPAFPPIVPGGGYTLSLWFQIAKFDPNAHTTLFGAFDPSQTCFVLVYLEKDTHNLILQTSVTSSRPSVRFKSLSFEEGRWYHISLTHRRPKPTSSSRASLFVNGEFVEQVKSQYPAPPPVGNKNGTEGSHSLAKASNTVQAFLGTPQDLASRLGKGLVFTQWRLASAHLFADVLSDDLMAVYYELGPKYVGNFQDCLGSFQTYEASATLNIRNESLHPGKEERSDIVSAIRSKAGDLLPEAKILLNISATNVFNDDTQDTVSEMQLLKSLSKTAGRNFRSVTRGGRNALAINGAIPAINEALLQPSGIAVLTGDPTVVIPQYLDDAAWRIGGCAGVSLALLEAAQTTSEVVRSLGILFSSIRGNWRNSEAMERDNGFGVLAIILATKLTREHSKLMNSPILPVEKTLDALHADGIALRVLNLILDFLGYRSDKPEESVINNPLAYRTLLVDFEVWRNSPPQVQELFYGQFLTFSQLSKYRQFNIKRLSRMRIIKKWLEVLKGDVFTDRTFRYFMGAFKALLTRNLSSDTMRSLALYITYAIHKPKNGVTDPSRSKSLKLRTNRSTRRQTTSSPSSPSPYSSHESDPKLTPLQVALKVLELYADLLCQKGDVVNMDKFARTVTNKWLLHLLADDEPTVVVLAAKILTRLLVISGPAYMQKFVDKTGGMVIMQHRLRRWWQIPAIWPICFAILFGKDLATIDLSRSVDLFALLETFTPDSTSAIVYPQVLPVITAMLQNGLMTMAREQSDPDSPSFGSVNGNTAGSPRTQNVRQRSISLSVASTASAISENPAPDLVHSALLLQTVVRFLTDVHSKSQAFRDFATTSTYVQEIFSVLFPIVVSANAVSPETELNSRASSLTFKGNDVIMRPISSRSIKAAPVVRTATAENLPDTNGARPQPLKRMSSYILVAPASAESKPPVSKIEASFRGADKPSPNLSTSMIEGLLELVVAVFSDQIFSRKDFAGLGLFMRVPPGFQEHQAYFETFILRNTLSQVGNNIRLNQRLLWEPRVLTNIARLATHLGEAIFEGWFIEGADDTLEFLGHILEYLQLPEVSSVKAIRLCSHIISNMRAVLSRVVLLRLSELNQNTSKNALVAFLNKLAYWQAVLVPIQDSQDDFLRLLCYLLYNKLDNADMTVRMAVANLWRMLLVHKLDEISTILQEASSSDSGPLIRGFKKIMELDNETFLDWWDANHQDLDRMVFSSLSKGWESYVADENRRTDETAKARISKRREKLGVWASEHAKSDETVRRHRTNTEHWRSNIYAAEHLKRQRALQDQQDSLVFQSSLWTKMTQELRRPCGVFDENTVLKWQLDQTEGRNRMRMRLIPDKDAGRKDYQPKRSQSRGPAKPQRSATIRTKPSVNSFSSRSDQFLVTKVPIEADSGVQQNLDSTSIPFDDDDDDEGVEGDEDFEMVDDPRDEIEQFEDKNRKVMRSLQRGDQVEHVQNVSRIVGLEAIEGLLIVGKGYLYLLDSLFQRLDGEIVNVWQAPREERDPYLQMISGREAGDRTNPPPKMDYETQGWRWDDVLSISKRRFLFRDVAIEVFFVDGRSYLLTTNTPTLRNELYQKLLNKATNVSDRATSTSGEDTWRIEAVRNPDDEMQTLGTRFTSVFAHNNPTPATKKWLKGEISNFHYLMLVNTMAGRTFNDLTQYPVFPWVLADYKSAELDLSNPRSFRDLTKPMGCQTLERQAEFKDRYQSFAEMGDHNAPPFHYGTHYSSAMIVTSYLIRLQPFVHSYLLLQGGSFDHADRLFYSIEKAWTSASRENMTDVRELIPEFFYLPEFLVNINHYDFGTRQGNGGPIDSVALPPWAKGDPKIFIAKHREALESEYVSQHLHAWIDLVFGHKQNGEAALEATNVFHHLSYHGAKDLDTIDDPIERLATIGIIHNFGQTPHQVFQRSHPVREEGKNRPKRLDAAAENLTRLPFPLLEGEERVSSLQYSSKHDRLLSSGPFRLNIGPNFDKYMEWGFIDGGVRFYTNDTKKLVGLFEHVHQGQLSCAIFADSKTLITAGTDCTISIWIVISSSKSVDLQPKTCLFGHRTPVSVLAESRSFSALLSASSDGQVILWDLNRLELVRVLTSGKPVECARIHDVTGVIMLCRGSDISLWTLNGELMLEQNVYVEGDDMISSCAFYEGSGSEYLHRDLSFTGHKRGVVNIWNVTIRNGGFVLEHVKRMHHMDQAGFNIGASITAILPLAQVVYTGDDDGRVYEWDCIQRQ